MKLISVQFTEQRPLRGHGPHFQGRPARGAALIGWRNYRAIRDEQGCFAIVRFVVRVNAWSEPSWTSQERYETLKAMNLLAKVTNNEYDHWILAEADDDELRETSQ